MHPIRGTFPKVEKVRVQSAFIRLKIPSLSTAASGCAPALPRVCAFRLQRLRRRREMLETIAVVLVLLWLLGLVSSYTLGGFIHLLLVLAIVVILIRLIQGRRVL